MFVAQFAILIARLRRPSHTINWPFTGAQHLCHHERQARLPLIASTCVKTHLQSMFNRLDCRVNASCSELHLRSKLYCEKVTLQVMASLESIQHIFNQFHGFRLLPNC